MNIYKITSFFILALLISYSFASQPYKVKIKLPYKLIEKLNSENINLLKDCETVDIQKDTVIANCNKLPTTLTIPLSKQEIEQELHIQIKLISNSQPTTPPIIDYNNKDYAIYSYSNKTDCRENTNHQQLESIEFTHDNYIRLFDELNDKPISRCTQTNEFKPYDCHGKRKLIIISTGDKLDKYGRQIPTTMLKVFEKQLKTSTPFTVVKIEPGRKLSSALLRCEDMADLEKSKETRRFIWQRLHNIRFGASDLRALQDLDLINIVYNKQSLQSVYYITYNSNIPRNINDINDKNLSVPLITWKRAGIPFTVLTTGKCTAWTQKAEAQCQTLQDEQAMMQIQTSLEEFLKP
ncbi:hypothetical protein [Candidatus Marithrix sp. Canyon 246]|uniref:hypothetical protein n=1 Tax=Candidatus Marithrix sp. Canyon 246 TaxID=1827136 RepID=UPI00084A14DD|nr:hypothetical protein [Candidatus Marithrix sp. Canyon 246]